MPRQFELVAEDSSSDVTRGEVQRAAPGQLKVRWDGSCCLEIHRSLSLERAKEKFAVGRDPMLPRALLTHKPTAPQIFSGDPLQPFPSLNISLAQGKPRTINLF